MQARRYYWQTLPTKMANFRPKACFCACISARKRAAATEPWEKPASTVAASVHGH